MSDIGNFEMNEFMNHLNTIIKPGEDFKLKPIIMETCGNMFLNYMCSKRFEYTDKEFSKIIFNFDEIFWEINQGYALDFLPWLKPFYKRHLQKLSDWTTEVRKFILNRVLYDREQSLKPDDDENDFTDALLKSLYNDPTVNRETILYMLEDFIGGSSAVGNLVMMALGIIAKYPKIGRKIQSEIDEVTEQGKRTVTLHDTENMPYTMSTIFEVLRYASSPIVPHVATEDACIAGYGVTKGTMVIVNNYILNTSTKFWDSPEKFMPERFLEESVTPKSKSDRRPSESSDSGIEDIKNGVDTHKMEQTTNNKVTKKILRVKTNIPHFLPFSIGKRTCIGQNLVRSFSFLILVNLLQQYDISCNDITQIKMHTACVALPADTYSIALTPRTYI